MSQIDPWALPQSTGVPADVGIPSSAPLPRLTPIPSALPIATMIAAALYSIVCLVAVFVFNSQASLAESLSNQDPTTITQATLDQANASDSHVKTTIMIALVLFVVMIVLWIVLQRRVRTALAPAGAYSAVYRRAGGPAVRIAWVVSLLLLLFSRGTSDSSSLSDIASHDHMNMLYLSVRVLLGAAIAFFAFRLMRITSEGIDRINSAR